MNNKMRVQDRWYYRIIRDSKTSDRLAKRTIEYPDKYVTTLDLVKMQEAQRNRCNYCHVFMYWMQRRKGKTGLTLERFNNALPHYADNCCLACKKCNSQKLDREKGLLKKYFCLWYNKTFGIKIKCTPRRCSYII